MSASWVLHVDLDQFIAAVEVLRRPELAGRPVVVGGRGDPSERGVVSTASYEARAFGVGSGMPLRLAAKRCPEAVFLPVDGPAYEVASEEVMGALRSMGAVVQVLGWDEAFLAVETDDPEAFARRIQATVLAVTGLHCSVGIGDNKLRAKIATDFGKPRGVFRLTEENWYPVMADRPTEALWGIGRRTAKRLTAHAIHTVRDLALADPQYLADHLGPTMGPWYRRLGRGVDTSPVDDTPYVARGRGRETTFQQNITDWDQIQAEIRTLAERVADDLRSEGRPAVRVAIKVRYAPFFTHPQCHPHWPDDGPGGDHLDCPDAGGHARPRPPDQAARRARRDAQTRLTQRRAWALRRTRPRSRDSACSGPAPDVAAWRVHAGRPRRSR